MGALIGFIEVTVYVIVLAIVHEFIYGLSRGKRMFKIEGTGKIVAARMKTLGYWKKGQPQVSRFSEERGFVPSYVYRWLRGETPRGERLFRLAEALETDPKSLVALPTTIRRMKKTLVSLVAVAVGVGTAGMAWARGDTLPRPIDATRYL